MSASLHSLLPPAGMLTGVAASSGIARGPAYVCRCGTSVAFPRCRIEPGAVPGELNRLEKATAEVELELLHIREETRCRLGEDSAVIFDAHALLLRDPELSVAVARRCRKECINVEAALSDTADSLIKAFAEIDDPLIRERAADLRDVTRRLLSRLLLLNEQHPSFPLAGSILVTHELPPSMAAELERASIAGIVAEQGGPTAHAVILARALGIPMLLYAEAATNRIKTDDPLILDALAGRVFIRPPPAIEREYERHQADLETHRSLLKESLTLAAQTLDGTAITLSANAGKIADAAAAAAVNAAGIGLYRTEFVFQVEDHFPSEAEQYLTYRKTAERIGDRDIVIRVLDVGSDKLLPYFPLPAEPNPSLGRRGMRLLLEHLEILTPQLRAVLRLSATHRVSVLFPMIGGVDEILAAKAQLRRVQAQLRAEGVPFNPDIRLGAMIETPSAVLTARPIAQEVDFLSIGSNDLTQYLLASDRGSHAMANYYEPLHPAVMLSLKAVVDAAAAEGKPVSICGEIAGNPAYTELLLGLGFRSFSVVPNELLEIKRVIRATTLVRAMEVAHCVLNARTIGAIKACLAAQSSVEKAADATSAVISAGSSAREPRAESVWENEGGRILSPARWQPPAVASRRVPTRAPQTCRHD